MASFLETKKDELAIFSALQCGIERLGGQHQAQECWLVFIRLLMRHKAAVIDFLFRIRILNNLC